MRPFRQLVRVPLVLMHVGLGTAALRLAIAWDRWRGHPLHGGWARRVQARWCRRTCRLLGIRVRLEGEAALAGPALFVANHVSWLDVPVIAAHWGLGFLSKSEIQRYPLIGKVATGLGTLYIARGRRGGAEEAAEAIRRRLQAGHPVLVFPEGTTSDGRQLLPFRPRLYQAALDAGVPIQTVAISYHRDDGSLSVEAAFTGEDSLFAHLVRLAAEPRLEARVRLGPALPPVGLGRTEAAKRSRQHIGELLGYEVD